MSSGGGWDWFGLVGSSAPEDGAAAGAGGDIHSKSVSDEAEKILTIVRRESEEMQKSSGGGSTVQAIQTLQVQMADVIDVLNAITENLADDASSLHRSSGQRSSHVHLDPSARQSGRPGQGERDSSVTHAPAQ